MIKVALFALGALVVLGVLEMLAAVILARGGFPGQARTRPSSPQREAD